MTLVFIFMLGIANFALHKAVLESGHPLLEQMPWFRILGGNFSLAVEYLMLAAAMLLVAGGPSGWVWVYAIYSALNGIGAWLIVTHRM